MLQLLHHYFGTKLLNKLDPEISHSIAICYLRLIHHLVRKQKQTNKLLKTNICGLDIPSPIGLAAGFDKNGEVYNATLSMGFGFVEVGTITPEAQYGNTKPRLFKLTEHLGLINRLGFNNKGMLKVARSARKPKIGVVGVNIGANASSINKILDYKIIFEFLSHLFDYVTINISSPNTNKLRDLQKPELLEKILKDIQSVNSTFKKKLPFFIKISPDISLENAMEILQVCEENNVDGLIATNTTIRRDNIDQRYRMILGGLSGRPLFLPSNKLLQFLAEKKKDSTVLIGVGGIFSASDIYEKIKLGASAVQIYTSFIYNGPLGVKKMEKDLELLLLKDGHSTLSSAVGTLKELY